MRWLIWYIRSCFCKHAFNYDEREYKSNRYSPLGALIKCEGPMISATCDKCGYHKAYWKFGK